MLLALVVAASLEAPASPSVELTRTGARTAPVPAVPRSLSDVAREMREGRRATGGFSAVESTVPRLPIDPGFLLVGEERPREEPEVAPEPEPAGYVSNEITGWGGGWWGPPPRRRPPHVSHHGPGVAGRRRGPDGRGGGASSAAAPPRHTGARTPEPSGRFREAPRPLLHAGRAPG